MNIYPDCKYPTCCPVRGYNKGCRCDRCKKGKSESSKQHYKRHRDKIIKRVNSYSEDKKEQKREYARKHYQNNKEKYVSNAKNRKTLKHKSYCNLTKDQKLEIYNIYKKCRDITEQTGIKHHVDHIKPISKGGLHHPDNLHILTAAENIKKKAKCDGQSGK